MREAKHPKTANQLTLPLLVATPVDLGRLTRELEIIEETLLQLGIRKPGSEVKMPKTSQLMDKTIEVNKLNLLHETERQRLKQFLEAAKEKAPVLHISFNADPSAGFIEQLMAWLRREINPFVLVSIGLQPNIGAGCVVRTTNKHFDLSLRTDFIKKQDLLLQALSDDAKNSPPAAGLKAKEASA